MTTYTQEDYTVHWDVIDTDVYWIELRGEIDLDFRSMFLTMRSARRTMSKA